MKYPFTIRRRARNAIRKIYDWYEDQSKGLGEEFLEELDLAFSRIKDFPENYPFVLPRVRWSRTRRFPYYIFYFFENNKIVILHCLHMHRDPRTWPNA